MGHALCSGDDILPDYMGMERVSTHSFRIMLMGTQPG